MTSVARTTAFSSATFALTFFCLLAAIASPPAQAQTFTILHTFAGSDGATPQAGLTMDTAGNLYGTTAQGGDPFCHNGYGCGTVFRLKRAGNGWVLNQLHVFTIGNGSTPLGRVIFGPDGALYGTTQGGGAFGDGIVFRLTPSPNPCHAVSCPWIETVLHDFKSGGDGNAPTSEVVFDPAGNLYGTTFSGGSLPGCGGSACGTVYKMSRSGTVWTETVIYEFAGGPDGLQPYAGLALDGNGNLYGTTQAGGDEAAGTAFKLTPTGDSWQKTTLHSFGGPEGVTPVAGVILDRAGNLYGGTTFTSAYELSPDNGDWDVTVLYQFPFHNGIGSGPWADLSMDSAGNLYGTTRNSSTGCGEVFKLSQQGGSWTETTLHEFQLSDGCSPMSKVLIDANGNLYGTAMLGGETHGGGVVWQITP